ncbi:MAG: universal stress protein [Candidatus Kapabacteria bacterium]|nr:universal stress protein [Candidatus Kapabacteria bacterium]MCS7169878.1 universal stress protein [Candidatus Kapabacteria bacterium]MDW7997216.1 universal stress protein [Bacteroidota bacterium]MDW8225724.1 universal stress protein [Bacteroidota bacterium]
MQPITNILVPTDFSEHAQQALGYAKELARLLGATLHIVHVVEPIIYPAEWGYSQVGLTELEQELTRMAEQEIHNLVESIRAEGISVRGEVLYGRASEQIIRYAQEHSIGLISIGTHGRGGLEHFLFGSTTERVLRKASCPVLAVRIPRPKEGR